MKLVEFSEKKVTIEMDSKDFRAISQMVSAVNDQYKLLDPYILDLPKEHVGHVDELITEIFGMYVDEMIKTDFSE